MQVVCEQFLIDPLGMSNENIDVQKTERFKQEGAKKKLFLELGWHLL